MNHTPVAGEPADGVTSDQPPATRVCKSCGEEKALDLFHKAPQCRYGRSHTCRKCTKAGRRQIRPPAGFKLCAGCKVLLPATTENFYREKITKDGLRSRCKACVDAQTRAYFHRNKDRLLLQAKHREARTGRMAKWYRDNAERRRAEWQEYYQTRMDHAKRREYEREHRRQNPALYKAKKQRRRALEVAAAGSFTEADLKRQYENQGGRCWWCGELLNGVYQSDHRISLFAGGTNYPSNIVCSCRVCNQRKGIKLPHEWNGRLL